MSRTLILFLSVVVGGMFAPSAYAQQQYVFPKHGQSPEQQKKDEYDCHTWAIQQTGYDPVAVAQASPSQTASSSTTKGPNGSAVKGAVVGAGTGAAIGALAGDAGKGAAIGAVTGGVGGKLRSKARQKDAQQHQAQSPASDLAKRQQEYQRARAACLEAKGYSVK